MYCTRMLRRVLKLLMSAILLEIPSAVVVAFTTSTKAVCTRHCDANGRHLCHSASSGIRRQTSTMYRGRSSPATTTSMSLLRTFEARELQLQRFIGELGFVEITDWCARYSRCFSTAIMCSCLFTRCAPVQCIGNVIQQVRYYSVVCSVALVPMQYVRVFCCFIRCARTADC